MRWKALADGLSRWVAAWSNPVALSSKEHDFQTSAGWTRSNHSRIRCTFAGLLR